LSLHALKRTDVPRGFSDVEKRKDKLKEPTPNHSPANLGIMLSAPEARYLVLLLDKEQNARLIVSPRLVIKNSLCSNQGANESFQRNAIRIYSLIGKVKLLGKIYLFFVVNEKNFIFSRNDF
jgi:hypothetical protein